jgi:sugar phosphate isomerase/epimerase
MVSESRRRFLAQSGGLSAVVLAGGWPRPTECDPLGMPIGIQLWSVKDALKSDPAGTLKTLRWIGYGIVESAGFSDLPPKDLRRLLDDAGLRCPSAHVNFMTKDYGSLFADAHLVGAQYVVSTLLRPGTGTAPVVRPELKPFANYIRMMTLDDAKHTAELANHVGESAKRAGLRYAYHNHFFEFGDQGGESIAYDVLLKETDPALVQFEIDCGWMKVAGYNPAEYFRRYPHRIPMIHVKDFLAVDERSPEARSPGLRAGAELGHGAIDYRPIFAAAKTAGLEHYFAEQEGPFTRMSPLDAAKASYDYLHSLRT